jgi:predicted CxxxxCH...CXXCH cytochrome family protein
VLLWLVWACVTPAEPPPAPSCAACHGTEANPAPPTALGGIDDPSWIGVGAHQVHLNPTGNVKPTSCGECHLFPEALDAPGHIDTPWPAEVQWGEVAKAGGAATPWDREVGTCTVWCHGSDAPAWVGGQAPCGSCHGLPPPAPHPQSDDCGACHPPSSPDTHVDGQVQLLGSTTGGTALTADTGALLGCDGCHGADGDPSPPPDTLGRTDPSLPSVGSHEAHVHGSGISDGVACTDCHVVPATVDAAGHIDPSPAEVPFGGLSTTGGLAPTYDGLTCSNTYCHAGREGGRTPQPEWAGAVDGSCQACHGAPPPAPHPQDTACDACHGSVAGPSFTIVDPMRHVDGTVDF